ncbi:hypothetical protein ACLB2K_075867 [Fragaria x ananassa]
MVNDKSKIKMVIEEPDGKKKETLNVTWVKVNKDFGSIFSTLLPGTMGKIEPPEGCSFLDGLERSLMAPSLILALLLFKPAPLYILDEVDAALDLSHTQNMGRMIKIHFPQSQFIVVSLKEGMFNNANVLFRTKKVQVVFLEEAFCCRRSFYPFTLDLYTVHCMHYSSLKKKGLLDFGFRYPLIHYSWNPIDLQQEKEIINFPFLNTIDCTNKKRWGRLFLVHSSRCCLRSWRIKRSLSTFRGSSSWIWIRKRVHY